MTRRTQRSPSTPIRTVWVAQERAVKAVIVLARVFVVGWLFLMTGGCTGNPLKPPYYGVVVTQLPQPGAKIVVWGIDKYGGVKNDELAVAEYEVMLWMQKKGYVVLEHTQLQAVLEKQHYTLLKNPDAALKAGRLMGAEQIVFVEAPFEGVYIRGVNIETGQIMWNGSGRYASDREAREERQIGVLTGGTLQRLWKQPSPEVR